MTDAGGPQAEGETSATEPPEGVGEPGNAPEGSAAHDGAAEPGDAGSADGGSPVTGPPDAGTTAISVEDLVGDLERVTVERDASVDARARLQAEFENYRKSVARREDEARFRATERLVTELLPVLDACEGAVANGAADVEPINKQLLDALGKLGLEPIGVGGEPFDPNRHEAVMTVEADSPDGQQVVVDVLRAGYAWNERTIRAAMVSVSS